MRNNVPLLLEEGVGVIENLKTISSSPTLMLNFLFSILIKILEIYKKDCPNIKGNQISSSILRIKKSRERQDLSPFPKRLL